MTATTTIPTTAPALYYGNTRTLLAKVIPDRRCPCMWRIRWPDGSLADKVNLTRAKDAAAATAERGPPRRDPRRLHWDRCETPSEAPPMRRTVQADGRAAA
jgi:hypothetical protein